MSNNPSRVTIIPNLLVERGRVDRSMLDQETVADAMRSAGWVPDQTHARVTIDGELIDQAQWERFIPQRGSSIVIRRVPQGGGGGGGGKQTGSMVAMIAVMALAIAAPYAIPGLATAVGATGGLWGGIVGALGSGYGSVLLSAGISIAGMLAVRALIPPPLPTLRKEIAHDEKSLSISPPIRRHNRPRRIATCEVGSDRRPGKSRRPELAARA